MAEYIERDAVIALAKDICILTKWDTEYHHRLIDPADVRDLPATNVPPALWTDEPISGTEFMTHNKGQSGFEIHFRTDDMSKYEAVQNECRRQIGHEKPAADAIEELQQTVEHYKGCSDDWYKEACDHKSMLPHWIPVTERLPKIHQWVLVASKLVKIRMDFISSDGHWYTTSGVTHWMPLPEPPKGEDNGDK